MLTRIRVKNFKKFDDVDIELGQSVVFIGPNNSGKTSALQALTLWSIGVEKWVGKKSVTSPEKRPGVTLNRNNLIQIPIPEAKLIWRNLHVRDIKRKGKGQKTNFVFVDITVEGIANDEQWRCGLEFYYANPESFYCRPLRLDGGEKPTKRMQVPQQASDVKVVFLPPMSGLIEEEPKLEQGWINVLIGQGRTAEVLRNVCYQIFIDSQEKWNEMKARIEELFLVTLMPPEYDDRRGVVVMSYRERNKVVLPFSSAGTGFLQTLLLLAYLYANPGAVILLDEPDAHLEVLRQRQTYQFISDIAEKQGSQIIAASHSEVILQEAADKDIVVAFVGKPHRIDDRGSQVTKALREIGVDQYYLAEQTGWVLYLEGSTDLAILQAFASTLNHPVAKHLDQPFVKYISNLPNRAEDHFFGLREAKRDLVGIAIFDRLNGDEKLKGGDSLKEMIWNQQELENYLCTEEVLLAYTKQDLTKYPLFVASEAKNREQAMREAIKEVSDALETLGKPSPWSSNIKASDDFLTPVFEKYFKKLGSQNLMCKSNYHILAKLVPRDKIDPEVIEKLDAIVEVAEKAKPRV